MKSITTGLILICLLTGMAGMATAETENKDLLTEGQLDAFIASLPHEAGFVNTASEKSVSTNPQEKYDIWKDSDGQKYISFYFSSDSARGYGSKYYSDSGSYLGSVCNLKLDFVEGYKGEEIKEEVKEDIKEETVKEDVKEEVEEKEEKEEENEEDYKVITKESKKYKIEIRLTEDEIEELTMKDKLRIINELFSALKMG